MTGGKSKGVSKLILRTKSYYVFSRKRKPETLESDDRLELIGGHIEGKETPLEALMREAREEEPSGIVAARARQLRPSCKRIMVGTEKHFIFEILLDDANFEHLKHDPQESRGFVKVEAETLDRRDELKRNLARFTPKIRKIFGALGWV